MKIKARTLTTSLAIMLVLTIPATAWAQHKHSGDKAGMKMDMPMMMMMMKSPHHKLMTAYMKSMSAFATSLREQAMKTQTMDVEVARATVAELRHDLDAMEALHQKHMQSMSAEMQSKMKMMMEMMDKEHAMPKDLVSKLETDVQPDTPNSAQVAAHANALLKHLGMMSKMGASKAGKKKMPMKKDMKTDPKMDMKKKT